LLAAVVLMLVTAAPPVVISWTCAGLFMFCPAIARFPSGRNRMPSAPAVVAMAVFVPKVRVDPLSVTFATLSTFTPPAKVG